MVLLSVIQVFASLGERLAKSIPDDRVYVRELMLNMFDIQLVSIRNDTGAGSELVIWSWAADRNCKPHQTL